MMRPRSLIRPHRADQDSGVRIRARRNPALLIGEQLALQLEHDGIGVEHHHVPVRA
jgi:hypothetical protein